MDGNIRQEVEGRLGVRLSDEQFNEALQCARDKQAYIYRRDPRPAVLDQTYLALLTEEYVKSLAFSRISMDLCSALRDMEKEHSARCQSAHMDAHIVSKPALKVK